MLVAHGTSAALATNGEIMTEVEPHPRNSDQECTCVEFMSKMASGLIAVYVVNSYEVLRDQDLQ